MQLSNVSILWKGIHRHVERGISSPARWHHFSVWTKCFRWERRHVYHRVSEYFFQAQQCQRDSRECPLSHLCSFWSVPSCYPSLSLLLMPFSHLVMTALYFSGTTQTPGSQLHDKQAAEGCSFFRPVEWALHGHAQSFWICFGQYRIKAFNS